MKKATLTRLETGKEGTFGEMICDGFICKTLELPWKDNAKGLSCIPGGHYEFRWRKDSPKHGECYEMMPDDEAPNRSNVQIHSANLAGDKTAGLVAQLEGCIALGHSVALFNPGGKDQRGITMSRATVDEFSRFMDKQPFILEIRWAQGVNPEKNLAA